MEDNSPKLTMKTMATLHSTKTGEKSDSQSWTKEKHKRRPQSIRRISVNLHTADGEKTDSQHWQGKHTHSKIVPLRPPSSSPREVIVPNSCVRETIPFLAYVWGFNKLTGKSWGEWTGRLIVGGRTKQWVKKPKQTTVIPKVGNRPTACMRVTMEISWNRLNNIRITWIHNAKIGHPIILAASCS